MSYSWQVSMLAVTLRLPANRSVLNVLIAGLAAVS